MQRRLLAAFAAVALSLTGCSWSDVFFSAFGGAYTGGGTTHEEKYRDYNDRLRSYEEM